MPQSRGSINREFTHNIALTAAEDKSDLKLTIGTPFLALTGELWIVCCEKLKKIDRVMANND